MKDRVIIEKGINYKNEEVIKFFLHCDLGVLYLMERPFSKGVLDEFRNGMSISEIRSFKFKSNKKLNKIIDRLPAYIKYAKQEAVLYENELKAYGSLNEFKEDYAA